MDCFENIMLIDNRVLYGATLFMLKKRIDSIIRNPYCKDWDQYSILKNDRITVLHFTVRIDKRGDIRKWFSNDNYLSHLHSYYEIYGSEHVLKVYNFCSDYSMQGKIKIKGMGMLEYLAKNQKRIYNYFSARFPSFFFRRNIPKPIWKGLLVANPLFDKLVGYYIKAGYMNQLTYQNGVLNMLYHPMDLYLSRKEYHDKIKKALERVENIRTLVV